jgi:hypothetical protein
MCQWEIYFPFFLHTHLSLTLPYVFLFFPAHSFISRPSFGRSHLSLPTTVVSLCIFHCCRIFFSPLYRPMRARAPSCLHRGSSSMRTGASSSTSTPSPARARANVTGVSSSTSNTTLPPSPPRPCCHQCGPPHRRMLGAVVARRRGKVQVRRKKGRAVRMWVSSWESCISPSIWR